MKKIVHEEAAEHLEIDESGEMAVFGAETAPLSTTRVNTEEDEPTTTYTL
jgi:hypothetical protein